MSLRLHGKKIVMTRPNHQMNEMAKKIQAYGGEAIQLPLLKINCTCDDISRSTEATFFKYSWIFFTSANGVHCFFKKWNQRGRKQFTTMNFAVVGPKTNEALHEYGYQATFIPDIYHAKDMAKRFLARFTIQGRLLLVRGKRSSNVIPEAFTDHQIPFDMIEVYETIENDSIKPALNTVLREQEVNFITFTSPSSVDAFEALREPEISLKQRDIIYACIGTTTEKRAQEHGIYPVITATTFTVDGLLERIHTYLNKGRII